MNDDPQLFSCEYRSGKLTIGWGFIVLLVLAVIGLWYLLWV